MTDVLHLFAMPIYDLNALYSESEINQISGFSEAARDLDIDALGNAYINLVEHAPKAALAKS
jgi:hypothetical protein